MTQTEPGEHMPEAISTARVQSVLMGRGLKFEDLTDAERAAWFDALPKHFNNPPADLKQAYASLMDPPPAER